VSGREKRFTFLLVSIILVIVAAFFTIQRYTALRKDRELQLTARDYVVSRGDLTVKLIANGTAQVPLERLRFPVGGIVKEVLVRVGDMVEPDTVIARLIETDFKIKVQEADFRLRDALARLNKSRQQYEAQIVAEKSKIVTLKYHLDIAELQYLGMLQVASAYSGQEIEQKRLSYDYALENHRSAVESYERLSSAANPFVLEELAVEQARAALRVAESNLNYTELLASRGGMVMTLPFSAGDTITANIDFATLGDLNNIRLAADIIELDINKISVGQSVEAQFDALPGETYVGKVLSIDPLPVRVGGLVNYTVYIGLPSTPANTRSGMSCTITFVLEELHDVLLVPSAAVRMSGPTNIKVVDIRDPQGKIVVQPVELGLSDGRFVEVLSGLQEGARVLLR
jgi:multidrug efflux pump subunit AcrA (membrane-fusion protein)